MKGNYPKIYRDLSRAGCLAALVLCSPALAQNVIITGVMLDFETGKRIENVKVSILFAANFNEMSKSDGHFYLTIPAKVHQQSDSIRISFQHKDYELTTKVISKDIRKAEMFLGDIVLVPKIPIIISGRVTNGKIPISDIKISIYSNFIKRPSNCVYTETQPDGRFKATIREEDLTFSRRVKEFYIDFTDLRKQYQDSLNVVYKVQDKGEVNIILRKAQ